MFNIPINLSSSSSMYSLSISKEFLDMYDDNSIDSIIEYLSKSYKNVNDLVDVINKSSLVEDKFIRKEFIIRDLKNTYVKSVTYTHGVTKASISVMKIMYIYLGLIKMFIRKFIGMMSI